MSLVLFLTRTLGFTLPGFLGDVLEGLIKGVQWLVVQLKKSPEPGASKLDTAVALGRTFADDYLDAIPAWKELGEDQRDRIIAGIVELILFFEHLDGHADDLNQKGPDSGDARRSRRKALDKFQDAHVVGTRNGDAILSTPVVVPGTEPLPEYDLPDAADVHEPVPPKRYR